MHEARLFRMYIPKALDGLEIDPITSMIVFEEIARADAAACVESDPRRTYGLWAAFLPEEAAREIYGAPDAVVAGALRPSGPRFTWQDAESWLRPKPHHKESQSV